ncbi:MAG: DUF1080 domain-containing protein [Verrucomicrobiota bacterium]
MNPFSFSKGVRQTLAVCGVTMAVAVSSAAEWQSLLDGGDLKAWKLFGKPDGAPIAWKVEGDVLAWQKGGGNLMTREKFRDFELELEWKILPGGNSGVMFGVEESSDKPWHTGPEIQVLDDSVHKDGKNPLTSTGAIYSLYPPVKRPAKAIGEWNALRVRVQNGKIQTWLNGELTAEATIGSEDWNARVAKSKFAKFSNFAKVREGHILLQDHSDPVWYRKIRIRRL